MLYLEKSARPDISCTVNQCARHSANPKIQHTAAVKRIGRYLLGTKDKGLIMKPNQEGMECWVDAAHAFEWNNKTASSDPSRARSSMGYMITYAGCPMHWSSKMQTEIALSTTEAEYIALSQAMREVLPITWLMEEAKQQGIPVLNATPKVHCKVFEDNTGAIEIANVPKIRPTRQLDFVLACTQADIERDLNMKLPAGFTVPGRTITEQDRRDYVLKLEKNLYGQKQAGRVWYLHLKKNLLKLGFKPSQHDECVFYYGKTIFIVHTDDTILLGPDKDEIDLIVKRLGKTFKIEVQGNLSDYLGIKIERKPDGILKWTQPTLTQSILKDLKLDGEEIKGKQNKPNIKPVPANTSVPLTDHRESPDHNPKDSEYRHVIGELLYLEKSTRPDISCAVHQCARHCTNPKIQHTAAVKRIGRYLLGTKD
jgi:hypothetical protein